MNQIQRVRGHATFFVSNPIAPLLNCVDKINTSTGALNQQCETPESQCLLILN